MRRILTVVIFLCSHLLADKIEPARHKIGVCIVAMDEYEVKAKELIESGRKFFCVNQDVTYFVFTDGEKLQGAKDVIKVKQENFGWPYVTLKRFQVYEEHAKLFEKMDYLFAVDADLVFVAPVGEEVLSNLVATQHPVFVKKRGDYESKKISAAYVGPHEGKHYFSCSLYGGMRNEFLNLVKEARKRVDADLEKKFISRWHDQSYLNRYLIDHPPTRILNPSYCYPEDWQLEYPKKLVASGKSAKKGRK
jgi:histo-blood group ABO system transferase